MAKIFAPTQDQIKLLSRGLSFIPTWKLHLNQRDMLRHDINTYHRRLKLAAYYEGKEARQPKPFTPRSEWGPKLNQLPPLIRKIIYADIYALNHLNRADTGPSNLPRGEIRAISELQRNSNIVLKPADKGSAVVIMEKQQYIWEAERQLHDVKYYKKLKSPVFPDTIPKVYSILDTLYRKKYINLK